MEAIELSIKTLEEAMEGDDPEKIKSRSQDVMEASMKLGEAIYKSEQEAGASAPEGEAEPMDEPSNKDDDDVVDADFEDLGKK